MDTGQNPVSSNAPVLFRMMVSTVLKSAALESAFVKSAALQSNVQHSHSGNRFTMKNALRFLLLIAVLAFPSLAIAQQPSFDADGAMHLETEKLVIVTGQGRFEFDAEIADQPAEHAQGLMFRKQMPTRHGMLFVFGETRQVTMWMKNTVLPLDMVFIKPDGVVAGVRERTVPFSEDIIPSPEPISHVLELNAGVARLIGIKPGDRVEHRTFVTR